MKKIHYRTRIYLSVSAALLCAALLCGCGEDYTWLWREDGTADAESLREELVIHVTDAETEASAPSGETDDRQDTAAPTEAEIATEAVTVPETQTDTSGERTEPVTSPADEPPTGTDAAEETVTDPPAETGTEPETESETTPGVVWTGEAHPGTDIYYVGSGENAPHIIVIDAGHQKVGSNEKEPLGPGSDVMKGKVSYGTTSSFTGAFEYELTLRIALALRDELIARGYSVVMVRETNEVNISNVERAQIANKYRADCFIRIHANGWTDDTVHGGMAMCQTAANPFPTCAAHYRESRLLAESVFAAYRDATGIGTYHGGIWENDDQSGTNWSEVPTTILEMGFMTNEADDALMASDEFRENAARGIADGIGNYLAAVNQS